MHKGSQIQNSPIKSGFSQIYAILQSIVFVIASSGTEVIVWPDSDLQKSSPALVDGREGKMDISVRRCLILCHYQLTDPHDSFYSIITVTS